MKEEEARNFSLDECKGEIEKFKGQTTAAVATEITRKVSPRHGTRVQE